MAARITELRLTTFKSFRDVVLPLAPLTVLIGRNGSGKSNALDGLDVLHRLSSMSDLRDTTAVRGGGEGYAPFGSDSFELGVRVGRGGGVFHDLDVRVQVRPEVRILWERLRTTDGVDGPASEQWTVLMETTEPDPQRSDIDAQVGNGERGTPVYRFNGTHLVTCQLPLQPDGGAVDDAALEVLTVLDELFHFDPVPHLMRDYVPELDVVLRRNGENVSATVAHLRDTDQSAFAALVDIVRQLPEQAVKGIEVRSGGFGEVMLGLSEVDGGETVTVPARQMSDGMLGMIAIITALLGRGGTRRAERRGAEWATILLLEELENGLHPTQAAVVLDAVARAASDQDFQIVITTHSPALLNALPRDDHDGVVVIDRAPDTGASRATRLVDLPGYRAVMATGGLGDVVTAGRLPSPGAGADVDTSELDRILGIG